MTTAGDLLGLLRAGAAATRTELGSHTGLSRSAITARVNQLLAAGLVTEWTGLASTGGRRPAGLAFNAAAGIVIGVAIGRSRSQVASFDLGGTLIEAVGRDNTTPDTVAGPAEVMSYVAEQVARLVAAADVPTFGVGMSLPGAVSPDRCCSLNSPVMRGWDGVPLAPYLAEATQAPIYLTTDTAALARSEFLGAAPPGNALVVKASTGLAAALILDGRLVAADRGVVGDIGHTPVPAAAQALCRCGRTGCLEAVAGGWALTQNLGRAAHIRELVQLANDGDAAARQALRESGRAVGEVVASAVNLVNPDSIVLGGDMADAFEVYSAGVRESVFALSTAAATRDLVISRARHGSIAGLVGCAALALDAELSPRAVDALLRRGSE